MIEYILDHSCFLVIPTVFSLFFGLRARNIFLNDDYIERTKPWDKWFYQFWFNFCGSAIGWVVFYYLLVKVNRYDSRTFPDVWDGVTLVFVFTGITGHLPAVLMGIIDGIKEIVERLIPKAKS